MMQTYKDHFKILMNAQNHSQRHETIKALISDKHNRDKIIDQLIEIIGKQSNIIYRPTPHGEKPGERKKYKEINRAAIIEQAAIQTALGILGPDGLLDDKRFIDIIDRSGMLVRLGRWQDHINTMKNRAVDAAKQFTEEYRGRKIKKVKIFGLGGSAAPHDIAVDIINNWRKSGIEIEVIHADDPNTDYIDEHTLVILCSFSGNTEETINCYQEIKNRNKTDMWLILTKNGELRKIAAATENNYKFIQLPDDKNDNAYVKQPRESVCLQMTATLTFLSCIGLEPGSNGKFKIEDLAFKEIFQLIKQWRDKFGSEVQFSNNPAKKLAFFLLYGIDYNRSSNLKKVDIWNKKVPFILVDRNNKAIGHEVRTQLHERSKLNAAYYEAPEFLHNLVESIRGGVESSQAGLDDDKFVYYFIRSLDEEKRIRLRLDKTIELVLHGKSNYAILNAEGKNPYQRALFATYFNAHMTTYLAILNGFDPLPVPTMSWIKNVMKAFEKGGPEEQKAQNDRKPLITIEEK